MATVEELNAKVRAAAREDDWATVASGSVEIGKLLWERRKRGAAVQQYIVAAIFQLQGVTERSPKTGDAVARPSAFDPAAARVDRQIVESIARFVIDTDATIEDVRKAYYRITEDIWLRKFPRSKDEVWAALKRKIEAASETDSVS